MPSRRRRPPSVVAGCGAGAALVAALTLCLVPLRGDLTRAGPALLLVLPVVAAGLVGGRASALVTAIVAAAGLNVAFIPPYWTLQIDVLDDGLALAVFVLVGLAVGTVVAREAERRVAAEQRAAELEEVHARNAELSAERAQLAEETNKLAMLERVDEQRAALLRSVSHDLRTPLATIQAVTSDLRAGTGYDDATRKELLDLVGDEAERLDRIVANLLNLSRIEAGALKPDRQAVVVEELVDTCVRRLQRVLVNALVVVDVAPDLPLADVDYSQIDQVLSNLLENAVRHCGARPRVTVDGRRRGDWIEIAVADDGAGVLPFERNAVFEPFRRGESSTSSGVGLAICKAIVEAHGGRIAVDGSPWGGARFSFTVPVHDG